MTKPIVFSGIQPSGKLHLGNYLGAISQWLELQTKYRCIFCVVDYHAITVPQDPKTLPTQIYNTVKTYLAAGINPKQSLIFLQSDIPEHTELAWILNCAVARVNDLNKMTQFKDKAVGKQEQNIGVGLFDYPVLMAADILLYQTDLVPVGEDQVQHIELARDLAKRFNHQFGRAFTIPEAKITKAAARIMGLDDATKKMSKSAANPNNYIALTDTPDTARHKIKIAQTDSGKEIKFDQKNKPAISNLLTIYSLLTGKAIKDLEKQYQGMGYGQFKTDLAEVVAKFLQNFQTKLDRISDSQVKRVLQKGATALKPTARITVNQVKQALGIN